VHNNSHSSRVLNVRSEATGSPETNSSVFLFALQILLSIGNQVLPEAKVGYHFIPIIE
jgi:hypothetical protein